MAHFHPSSHIAKHNVCSNEKKYHTPNNPHIPPFSKKMYSEEKFIKGNNGALMVGSQAVEATKNNIKTSSLHDRTHQSQR